MLYVVHCVDTEGPLYEPLDATFVRIRDIFGLDLPVEAEVLEALQAARYDLGSRKLERAVARLVARENLDYHEDWDAIDGMLDRLDAPGLRHALPDDAGGGWWINWHCLAHHGFDPERNPRRRDLGPHAVFDRYRKRYAASPHDSIHWHFHPIPFSRQVNHCATSYFGTPVLFEILSRRVLERGWFPCVNRPGCHAERPDSHWFLEQWLPYDIANINTEDDSAQPDMNTGRFGDWRRAPRDWTVYHPHHDDYQAPGSCRRAIARCLNLDGRFNRLSVDEIRSAFVRASREPTLMAFVNHDFRDMERSIRWVQAVLGELGAAYPAVGWRYADAASAMRAVLGHGDDPPVAFTLDATEGANGAHRLSIEADRPLFGPQPWFCFESRDGRIWYDNVDRDLEPLRWHYTFDAETTPWRSVARIGVASNTPNGRTTVATLDPATGRRAVHTHN